MVKSQSVLPHWDKLLGKMILFSTRLILCCFSCCEGGVGNAGKRLTHGLKSLIPVNKGFVYSLHPLRAIPDFFDDFERGTNRDEYALVNSMVSITCKKSPSVN